MRPIAINQRALRGATEVLDSAREGLRSALVDVDDLADAAHRTVDGLERREQGALDDLEEMVLAGRAPEEIQAQATKVATIHRELVEARVQARDLRDAEDGEPRLVAEQTTWPAPTDLRDRLG